MSEPADWPGVTVVMPVRDEARDLERSVGSVLQQEYDGLLEVVVAVAPSHDDTAAIARRLADADPRVVVVDNPTGGTAAGLNAAIRAGAGDVVVRVDGHAELSTGYIRRAVETLRRTGAVNVGGVQDAVGESELEVLVAQAMTSWFGTGGARFHVGGAEGPVDTVYLGVFDRSALEAAGSFDEALVRNQDYELNIRLRDGGGVVWFDPHLRVRYRPRGSFRALARQYYEYGWWKAEVARRHPGAMKARQIAPPVAMGSVAVALVVAVRRPVALLVPATYLGAATIAAAQKRRSGGAIARLVAVFATMHLSWATGFVAGLVGGVTRSADGRAA